MKFSSVIFPFFLALVLLFAQQAGVVHSLHHSFENFAQQQENKQAPHSYACEKCAQYAQLGSALNVGAYNFKLLPLSSETVQHFTVSFRSINILAAVARGPPQSKTIA